MATADERLATLEEKQKGQDEHCVTISHGIREAVVAANGKLDRIEKAILAPDGLMMRVDRLEQKRKVWLWLATPPSLAIFGAGLRAIIWGF